MGETSIPCREQTRDRLRGDKTTGVSWDRYLNDLLDAAERADDAESGGSTPGAKDYREFMESSMQTVEERTGRIERTLEQLEGGGWG